MEGVEPPSNTASGSFFTPLLVSLAGIVFTSLVIVAYHLIVVRYCQDRSRREQIIDSHLEQLPEGIDQKILDTIPILSYSTKKADLFCVDQTECVVCLGELEEGEMVRLLPNCRHAFHITCIDKWFLEHSNCPVCRSPIVVAPKSTSVVPLAIEVHGEQDEGGAARVCAPVSASSAAAGGLLGHCVSPDHEGKTPRVITALKRSLSMDQSHIIINIETEREKISFSSSSPSSSSASSSSSYARSSFAKDDLLIQSKLHRVPSVRQFDHQRMPWTFLRSFSQLRLGRNTTCSTANGILPH